MPDTRTSLWLRWPDRDNGPLWLGIHLNQRAGENVLVGLELWTEEPGEARQSLGPAAGMADDLLPWPPTPIRAKDVTHLSLGRVRRRLETVLSGTAASPEARQAAAALRPQKPGRTPLYDDAHFARVAGVYRRSVEAGSRSPSLEVARTWNVSRSTGAKWVMKARQMGLLPPVR